MPGPGPHFMPPEDAEARDARTAEENEQRDALRRELLELQELVNAARVHAPVDAQTVAPPQEVRPQTDNTDADEHEGTE